MSRTILDPQYANDLNGLFDGTGTFNAGSIVAQIVTVEDIFNALGTVTCAGVVSSGAVNAPSISLGTGSATIPLSATSNTLVVGTSGAGIVSAGEFTGTQATVSSILTVGTVQISTPTALTLTVNGGVNATSFTGGIGMAVLTAQATGTLAPQGGVVFQLVEIPNFVGSATSAYVVSNNTAPAIPYLPFTFYVNFVSTSSGNTYVDVTVINCSSTLSYSASIDFSVIAMN